MIIGSIYRHTTVQSFLDTFFRKTLQFITKTKKTCILAGDFNVDLIKYGDNNKIDDFYDELSTHSFRPLILQPSRVTTNTHTLIPRTIISMSMIYTLFHLAETSQHLYLIISANLLTLIYLKVLKEKKKLYLEGIGVFLTKLNSKKNFKNVLGIM